MEVNELDHHPEEDGIERWMGQRHTSGDYSMSQGLAHEFEKEEYPIVLDNKRKEQANLIVNTCAGLPKVTFEQGAVKNLTTLHFRCDRLSSLELSGLDHLKSIKEVLLEGSYDDDNVEEGLNGIVDSHPNERNFVFTAIQVLYYHLPSEFGSSLLYQAAIVVAALLPVYWVSLRQSLGPLLDSFHKTISYLQD